MPCGQQVGPGELSQAVAPDQKPVSALCVGAVRVRGSPRAGTLCPRRGSRQQPSSPGPLCRPRPCWGRNTYTCAASARPGGPALPRSLRHGHTSSASQRGCPAPFAEKVPGLPHLGDALLGRVSRTAAGAQGRAGGSKGLPGAGRGWAGLGPPEGKQQRGECRLPGTCWPRTRPWRAPAHHTHRASSLPPVSHVLLPTCISCL